MNEPKEVEPEYFIKLLLLGDISVGKSSFIYRFIYDKFNPVEMPSSKLDLQSSDIIVSKNKIRVQLWDTVGQEKFRSITQSLISKMQGIVLMFDLTNKETYDNIKTWIELIREQSKKLPIIIIGNKCDLEEERIIQKEEAKGYYKKQKLKYVETSCKNGTNIKKAISKICKIIINSQEKTTNVSFSISSSNISTVKKRHCC